MTTKKYTWKPDVPDQRDQIFVHAAKPRPNSVNLTKLCPPVVDQGQLGSCTANALAGALGYIHKTSTPFSRLFVYYNERSLEGTIREDAGAMIRDGVKTLVKLGACPETDWAYNITKFKAKPSSKCYKNAVAAKVSAYQRLTDLESMLQCLASGFPFVFGFTVYESFEGAEVAQTGIVPIPLRTEKSLGGHAVMAVGYDDTTQRIIVRNSWGTDWGQSGYFTLPYAYLTTRGLSDDFWVITK